MSLYTILVFSAHSPAPPKAVVTANFAVNFLHMLLVVVLGFLFLSVCVLQNILYNWNVGILTDVSNYQLQFFFAGAESIAA
jgi:hypothetical protein